MRGLGAAASRRGAADDIRFAKGGAPGYNDADAYETDIVRSLAPNEGNRAFERTHGFARQRLAGGGIEGCGS